MRQILWIRFLYPLFPSRLSRSIVSITFWMHNIKQTCGILLASIFTKIIYVHVLITPLDSCLSINISFLKMIQSFNNNKFLHKIEIFPYISPLLPYPILKSICNTMSSLIAVNGLISHSRFEKYQEDYTEAGRCFRSSDTYISPQDSYSIRMLSRIPHISYTPKHESLWLVK